MPADHDQLPAQRPQDLRERRSDDLPELPLLWLIVWAMVIPLGVGLGVTLEYFAIGDQTAARLWCRLLADPSCLG